MIEQTPHTTDTLTTAQTPIVEADMPTWFLWPHYTNLEELQSKALFRDVTPTEVFGTEAQQASLPILERTLPNPVATSGYGLLLLMLLLLYVTLLYRHTGDVIRLTSRFRLDRAADERLQEDSGSSFSRFLTFGTLLAYGLLGLVLVRIVVPYLPAEWVLSAGESGALIGSLIVTGTLLATTLLRLAAMAIIGTLTFSKHLMGQLWLLKRSMLTLIMILCTPPMAMWLLMPPGEGRFWLWVIFIELIVSLILYLHESRTLFLAKKISILHWFLYLCAVEIFPISLLCLLALRQ